MIATTAGGIVVRDAKIKAGIVRMTAENRGRVRNGEKETEVTIIDPCSYRKPPRGGQKRWVDEKNRFAKERNSVVKEWLVETRSLCSRALITMC